MAKNESNAVTGGVGSAPVVVVSANNRELFDRMRATRTGPSSGGHLDKEAERRRLVHKLQNGRSFRTTRRHHQHHRQDNTDADSSNGNGDDSRSVGSSFRRPLQALLWRGSKGSNGSGRRASLSTVAPETVGGGRATSVAAAFAPRRFAQKVQSFRWKKTKSTARTASNSNIVMDLSDIQSMTSEPERVGNKKLSFFGRSQSSAGLLETNSLGGGGNGRTTSISARRQPGNLAAFLSPRDSNSNKEPLSQSRGEVRYSSGGVADDEDITVSSGFDPSNRSDDDDDDVVLQETPPPPPRELRSVRSCFTPASNKGPSLVNTLPRPPVAAAAAPTTTTITSSRTGPADIQVEASVLPIHATTAAVLEPRLHSVVNADNGVAVDLSHEDEEQDDEDEDEDEDLDIEVAQATAAVSPSAQPTTKGSVPLIGDKFAEEHKYDRWSPISFEVPQKEPPKPPTRRVEELKEEPEFLNEHEDSEEASDDSSVYSILSGLWAAWEAENVARKNAAYVDYYVPPTGISPLNSRPPERCCLKTSLFLSAPGRIPHSVRFGYVQIREYERTLGDNPSCTVGPPLSLGWNYMLVQEMPVEIHSLRPRRSKRQFHVSPARREEILLEEWGCTSESLLRARRDAIYAQYCRSKSAFADDRLKEAAYLRKANRTPQKPQPDHDEGSLSPPPAPTRRSSAQEVYSPWSAPVGGSNSCTPPTPVRRFPSSPIAAATTTHSPTAHTSPTRRSFSREIYAPPPSAPYAGAVATSPSRRSFSREIYAPPSPSRGQQQQPQQLAGFNSPTQRAYSREVYTPPPYAPPPIEYDVVEMVTTTELVTSPPLPRRASLPSMGGLQGGRMMMQTSPTPHFVPDLDMMD